MANQTKLLAERSYFLEQQLHLAQQVATQAKHLLAMTQKNVQNHTIKTDEFALRQATYLDLQDQAQILTV